MGATQLAHALNIATDTVYNWERNRTNPEIRFIPQIVQFLGCDPTNSPAASSAGKIKKYRTERGLSQERLARQLGIDPLTVRRLEYTRGKTSRRILDKILEILG
jgi:transcriptional regulator with XRE-family HTH domain